MGRGRADKPLSRMLNNRRSTMTSTITHPRFGEITLSQTWRARRISISIRPPGRIRLSMPYRIPVSEGLRFLESREEWVRRVLDRMAVQHPRAPIAMPYATRHHTLQLVPCDTPRIRCRITAERIEISYPLHLHYADETVQTVIRKGIEEAWRAEARAILPSRLAGLAAQYGFRYGKVAVRNTVSKWGSCSSRNDISLSLHLMRLPDRLIDFVLLHELCHTVHKNHGPKFHALLDRCLNGNEAVLRKELRQFSTRW